MRWYGRQARRLEESFAVQCFDLKRDGLRGSESGDIAPGVRSGISSNGRRDSRSVLVLLLTFALGGCTSVTYSPPDSPCIERVQERRIRYYKDGNPGPLRELVRGNARAEEEAHAAERLDTAAIFTGLGSLVALGGVVPLMLEHPPSGAGRTVAVSLVVTGLVSAFVATPIVAHEARAHRDAAVSLYNEGVSPACPRASSDVTDR